MKIENYKRAIMFRFYVPTLLIFALTPIVLYYFDIEKHDFYPILSSLCFLALLIIFVIKPYYFSLETKNNNIYLKFYNPYSFRNKYYSIVINQNELVDYEIKKFLGLKKQITFVVIKNKQKAYYKPISITLLSKKQIEELESQLRFIIKSNQV